MLMTIKKIADKLNVNETTIRTWLGNYRFEKYRQEYSNPTQFNVTNNFYNDLNNFLENKYSKTACILKRKLALFSSGKS